MELVALFQSASRTATSSGRAGIQVASIEPSTLLRSDCDRFHAAYLGCTNVIKCIYMLRARPVDSLPGVGARQPFYEVQKRGTGLNEHDGDDLVCMCCPLMCCY